MPKTKKIETLTPPRGVAAARFRSYEALVSSFMAQSFDEKPWSGTFTRFNYTLIHTPKRKVLLSNGVAIGVHTKRGVFIIDPYILPMEGEEKSRLQIALTAADALLLAIMNDDKYNDDKYELLTPAAINHLARIALEASHEKHVR